VCLLQELALIMWALVKLKFRLSMERHADFVAYSRKLLRVSGPQVQGLDRGQEGGNSSSHCIDAAGWNRGVGGQ
jgi:hypothetical protein